MRNMSVIFAHGWSVLKLFPSQLMSGEISPFFTRSTTDLKSNSCANFPRNWYNEQFYCGVKENMHSTYVVIDRDGTCKYYG